MLAKEPSIHRLHQRCITREGTEIEELGRDLTFAEDGVDQAWQDPTSCSDLYAIALAHFYEQDRSRNFWHLDEIVREGLTPACERLARSLRDLLTGKAGPSQSSSA